MVPRMTMPTRLGTWERALLLVPAIPAAVFGVGLLVVPGNRFVGAEGVGCVAALAIALWCGDWTTARLPTVAALAISTAVLYACVATAAGGGATASVYLILGAAAVPAASAAVLLFGRRGRSGTWRPAPDVGRWLVWFLALRTAVAWLLGLGPLFFPAQFVHTFGVTHANLFLYRLGGAGLVGYAVMGIGELRSRRWSELRAPAAMVLVLVSLCAAVSLVSLAIGERSALGVLVAIVASATTVGTVVELRHASR